MHNSRLSVCACVCFVRLIVCYFVCISVFLCMWAGVWKCVCIYVYVYECLCLSLYRAVPITLFWQPRVCWSSEALADILLSWWIEFALWLLFWAPILLGIVLYTWLLSDPECFGTLSAAFMYVDSGRGLILRMYLSASQIMSFQNNKTKNAFVINVIEYMSFLESFVKF